MQVTGEAPLVDTRSTGVGTVVESERIIELPLNARQVTQLITLSGLAVQMTASPAFSMNTGVRISVAGGNEYGVSYSLDGAPHLNNFDGTLAGIGTGATGPVATPRICQFAVKYVF